MHDLQVVHADDLVDPPDKWRHFDVNTRNVHSPAAEAPRHQACQLIEAIILTNQGTTSISLWNVVQIHNKMRCNISSSVLKEASTKAELRSHQIVQQQ